MVHGGVSECATTNPNSRKTTLPFWHGDVGAEAKKMAVKAGNFINGISHVKLTYKTEYMRLQRSFLSQDGSTQTRDFRKQRESSEMNIIGSIYALTKDVKLKYNAREPTSKVGVQGSRGRYILRSQNMANQSQSHLKRHKC